MQRTVSANAEGKQNKKHRKHRHTKRVRGAPRRNAPQNAHNAAAHKRRDRQPRDVRTVRRYEVTDKIGQRTCSAAPERTAKRCRKEIEYPTETDLYPEPGKVERQVGKALQHHRKCGAYRRYGKAAKDTPRRRVLSARTGTVRRHGHGRILADDRRAAGTFILFFFHLASPSVP